MAHSGTSALDEAAVNDIMRLGFESALRDRAAQFAGLEEDFSNRERVLARRCGEALAALDSVKPR